MTDYRQEADQPDDLRWHRLGRAPPRRVRARPRGRVLATTRIPDGIGSLAALHAVLADHADDPASVVAGIETDRGLLVGALVAAGYQVVGVNPLAASRYRERHTTSRARATLATPASWPTWSVPTATTTAPSPATAPPWRRSRSWPAPTRPWSGPGSGRSTSSATPCGYYPGALGAFGTDLASPDAVAVLAAAPTPTQGRALGVADLTKLLRAAGRQRNLAVRASQVHQALAAPQLAPLVVAAAYGQVTAALVGIIAELTQQVTALEDDLTRAFRHTRTPRSCVVCPDSAWSSAPGCWPSSGTTRPATVTLRHARPTRAPPGHRASGTARSCWPVSPATSAWPTPATGGRSAPFPLTRRPGLLRPAARPRRGHHQALRALANRLVGILHGCLRHRTSYDEQKAWSHRTRPAAA